AFVDWRLLAPGTPWTYRWLVDGEVLFEHTETWAASAGGADFWFRLGSDRVLPDGSYTLEIVIGGQLFVSETVRVGLGQLPVTAGEVTAGVQVSGIVVDAETGEGIPGVLFMVLEAQYSVEDFVWDEEQILGMSTTDSRGVFEIDRLLPYGEFYSVVITASGYLPVTADGIEFNPELEEFADNKVEFRLEMNRDLTS
ncbi:MAG: carboxypeptidase regulatory-like domain-containing protein, partial [Anaerolineae bacterium]|nr:carboxypeptidase regulatory-like domain-containing protein [Anaerolineae bacterium]